MSLNSIPSSNNSNDRFQKPEIKELRSKLQTIAQRTASKFPNMEQMDAGELPREKIEQLRSGPMAQIIQQMFEKAKAISEKPSNEILNSPQFLEIVEDGFLQIITTIVKEVEQLPKTIVEVNKAEQHLIAECHVNEAVFSHALDPKPVVATDSLGPCVGVAGYDSENQNGFVIHFAIEANLKASKEMLTQKIKQMATKPITTPIAIHLRGGIANGSEPLVDAIEEWVQDASQKGCPMTIVSKEVLQKEFVKPMSISLDTRNGTVSNHTSAKKKLQITNPKEINDLHHKIFIEALEKKPIIKIVYEAEHFKSDL